MRLKALAIAGAAAGALALTASPASANPFPIVNWQPVNTTPDWSCTAYVAHPSNAGVKVKGCIVKNRFGDAQGVLVVQNAAGGNVTMSGTVRTNFGSNVNCAVTPMGQGATRGCFAPTALNVGSNLTISVGLTLH